MTLQEIQTRISYLINSTDAIGLTLYVVYNNNKGEEQIRLADIDSQSGIELKKQFLDYLQTKFLLNNELSLMNISDGDNRKNVVYNYDLVEKPEGLNSMNIISQNDNQAQFSFSNDDFNSIKAFVIAIGTENNKILIFKKHHHLSVLKGITTFGIKVNDHRFVRVREDIIKLSPNIDFIQIEEELLIINLKTLESGFGFEEIIRKKSTENIDAIEAINLLEDISILRIMATDLKNAKHFMKIKANSPVIQLPTSIVIDFVKTFKPIMHKFRLSQDGTRLKLDTKVSQKLFLSLINDDLLTSELTKLYYEGIAKDQLVVEE